MRNASKWRRSADRWKDKSAISGEAEGEEMDWRVSVEAMLSMCRHSKSKRFRD